MLTYNLTEGEDMTETGPNVLVVAGLRNESSLSWAALELWMQADTDNQAIVTYRNDSARAFLDGRNWEYNNRIVPVRIDWKSGRDSAPRHLQETLTKHYGQERVVAGALHAIARAHPDSFKHPAHEVPLEHYEQAFAVSTLSLIGMVQGVREHLAPGAGIVTFGYGHAERIDKEYGGPMALAKAGLSHMVKSLAQSLGYEAPHHARVAEIATGFIPTNSGRGVAARLDVSSEKTILPHFAEAAFIPTDPYEQRQNAGHLALAFMTDPMFSQTTGVRFDIDGGRLARGQGLLP